MLCHVVRTNFLACEAFSLILQVRKTNRVGVDMVPEPGHLNTNSLAVVRSTRKEDASEHALTHQNLK